ncbi:MAG: hypothetical protein ACI9S8_003231, partial [Chlamydiales bacterium]
GVPQMGLKSHSLSLKSSGQYLSHFFRDFVE